VNAIRRLASNRNRCCDAKCKRYDMRGIGHASWDARNQNLVSAFCSCQRHCGTREGPMETNDLRSMPLEELWKLHEELIVRLGSRLAAEKAKLEKRLRELRPRDRRMRRPYPKVFPKYQNPKNPTETWSGRGRQPRWLSPQLRSGKKLDDFRIHNSSDHARRTHA
jgi:DNA-binding protein H-NS